MVSGTIDSWNDVVASCTAYALLVGGLNPATPSSIAADTLLSHPVFHTMNFMPVEAPPPAYSAYEQHPLVARLALENDASDQIYSFLAAPDVLSTGLRKSDLMQCANQWNGIGDSLRYVIR